MKITMRYHLTQVRMAIIKKISHTKCWRGCEEKGTLVHCWWECKLVQPLWKTVWSFLKKLKIELPYDPTISLVDVYWKKIKSLSQRHIFIPRFIAALLMIAKTWKQSKCPSRGEWINMCFYIHVMEYYSALRKKEILPFATNGWNLRALC